MTAAFDVLVVCEGNLCRSPLAERLLRLRLADLPHVSVASAGVRAVVGAPMDAAAEAELTRLGGESRDFVARRLTAEMASSADLVLTATRALRSEVVGLAPAALKRTFTLLELAALLEERPWEESDVVEPTDDPRALIPLAAAWRATVSGRRDDLDIPDPIRKAPYVHRTAANLADEATRTIADWLTSAST